MQNKIFINCPYDDDYKQFFFALIYICEFFGYDPIFAACDESSSDRMENIVNCIKESRYSIHDISKINEKNPRYNMPFELGMYYMHIRETDSTKKMLILEGEKNKSDITLSDLSGSEIKCHNNDLEGVFRCVRPFFVQLGCSKKDSPNRMYKEYLLNCLREIDTRAKENGYESYLDLDSLEYKRYIEEYCLS